VPRALVIVLRYSGLLESARPELEEVIKTHPDFAEAHADHGIVLAKLRDYRQALSEIRQGIELGYSVVTGLAPRASTFQPCPLLWGRVSSFHILSPLPWGPWGEG
jgi:hypothetical protein